MLKGLTLTAGGRYDHHERVRRPRYRSVCRRLGPAVTSQTILRASFGQGFKAPSLYQLYSNYGNQALQPETANSWDAGDRAPCARMNRLVVAATYFQRNSRDLINFFDCTTPSPLCATEPFGYYANIARTFAHGVELDGSLRRRSSCRITANYTLTDTEDHSPGSSTYGNELPRRPKDAGNAEVTYAGPSG